VEVLALNQNSIYKIQDELCDQKSNDCMTKIDSNHIIYTDNPFGVEDYLQPIEQEDLKQILLLTREDFKAGGGVYTHEFINEFEKLFVYIINNLSHFNQCELYDIDEDYSVVHFYWDVCNDPVIPYIVGLTPERFKSYFEAIYGPYKSIMIKLRRYSTGYVGEPIIWTMHIFEVLK